MSRWFQQYQLSVRDLFRQGSRIFSGNQRVILTGDHQRRAGDLAKAIVNVVSERRLEPLFECNRIEWSLPTCLNHRGDDLRMALDIPLGERGFGQRPPTVFVGIGRVEYAAVKVSPPIRTALGPPGVVHPSTSRRTFRG